MRIKDWSSDGCSSDLLRNDEAKRLGMTNGHFCNSNGWPDEGITYVTARDLTRLAAATIEETPDLYKRFYATTEFTWGQTMGGSAITQANRNPILGKIRSEEHTSELQSLMRISYAVFCLKTKNTQALNN